MKQIGEVLLFQISQIHEPIHSAIQRLVVPISSGVVCIGCHNVLQTQARVIKKYQNSRIAHFLYWHTHIAYVQCEIFLKKTQTPTI